MSRPPRDPRQYRTTTEPTWEGIIITTAVVLAVPLAFWLASHPFAGGAVLAAGAGVVLGGRRALRLRRCLEECGGFAVDLGGDVRVRVSRTETSTAC